MVANQKFFLLLIPTCLIFLLSLFTIANGEVVDRVVAEVNNEVITLSEIEEEGKGQFKQIALE
ncbi:MAG: hypothetical protein EX260_06740, partial [Desulfobulbaceae bacterium]